jgi:hypothetical protein
MRTIAFVAGCALSACTSGGAGPIGGDGDGGGTSSSGGSSGTPVATPQAIARLNGGAAAECATVPAFDVGQFADATAHRPVKSGESDDDGQAVTVACRIAPNGTDFAVNVSIAKGTTTLAIEDDVDAKGGSITAKVDLRGGGASWSSASCTLDATGVQMGIAPGRYWAMVTCMGATSAGGETCDIFGEIRVENCTPQ